MNRMLPDQVERGVHGTSGLCSESFLAADFSSPSTGRVTGVSPVVFLSLLSHLQMVSNSSAYLTVLLLCLSKTLSTLPGK